MIVTSEKKNNYLLNRKTPQVIFAHPILQHLITLRLNGTNLRKWVDDFDHQPLFINGKKIKTNKMELMYYYQYLQFLRENQYFDTVKKVKEASKMQTKHLNNINKDPKKSYWLYLHPYVHVAIKKDRAILYNTLNSKLLEYHDNPEILGLIKRLHHSRNLYVIRLYRKQITSNIVKFISRLKLGFIGDLMDASYSSGKPIQFKPQLSLKKGVDLFLTVSKKDRIPMLERDSFKDYLESIHLYINQQCGRDCRICSSAHKQFLYCFKTRGKKELSARDVKDLLEQAKGSRMKKLNILGGDIFNHSQYFSLVHALTRENYLKKEYFVHYLNIPGRKRYLEVLNDEQSLLKILIDFPLKEEEWKKALAVVNDSGVNFSCQFVVEAGKDIGIAERVISENNIKRFGFSPYFNGENTTFFRENVFIHKNDIVSSSPSQNDIFDRATLNRFHFGNITILSNRDVYANVNNTKLGRLGENEKDLFMLIAKELREGKSWAKIRKHVEPCNWCVFNALCPPITNYEYALGYYNLCNIWKDPTSDIC